jgi:hypothetical protein
MDFLVFVGCLVIYLTEYLIQSYIAIPPSLAKVASGYIAVPPSPPKVASGYVAITSPFYRLP